IMPLLLISFLENASKHGVSTDEHQPIRIDIGVQSGRLYFKAENAKNQLNKDQTKGVVLTNLRRRLQLGYPDRHTINVTESENYYSSELFIYLYPKNELHMVRCIAVDDEPLALDIIADYVGKIPELTLVASTTNAIEALTMVQNGEVDLAFLDVQMPELTGIQFLKIINGKCDVILTTAYPQYALDGYELNVVDYLLKPIAFDRFYRSVQKVMNNRAQQPVPA